MNKKILLLSGILQCLFFFGCNHDKVEKKPISYNEKANELIKQVLSEQSGCYCIVKPPDQSIVEISEIERPLMGVRGYVLDALTITDNAALDSLAGLSKNFTLDTTSFNQKCIKVISEVEFQRKENIKEDKKRKEILNKKCPHYILLLKKPIFNKNFTVAVIDTELAYTCLVSLPSVYTFDGKKWNYKNPYAASDTLRK